MATMAAEGAGDQAARLPMPSRNPLPLSASQEAQIRDIFHARVRKKCADEIKGVFHSPINFIVPDPGLSSLRFPNSGRHNQTTAPRGNLHDLKALPLTEAHMTQTAFAECALGRTFTTSFACREPHRIMNSCMKTHATQQEQDAAREEWFAQRLERQRERERKARRKAEQEAFLREWWGLPEKDREAARREMEKLNRGERVGGFPSRSRGVAPSQLQGTQQQQQNGEGGR
jgi:COX assembly protein 1